VKRKLDAVLIDEEIKPQKAGW